MKYIIGIDECGRGSGAGELTIAAVRAPENWNMEGLNDSKALPRKERERLSNLLIEAANTKIIEYAIASKSNIQIDNLGLGKCLKLCYTEVINQLFQNPDQVILDGNLHPKHLQEFQPTAPISQISSIIKADTKIKQVMAASIIAKHYRDTLMRETYDALYPQYDFKNNVGYLSKKHREAIKQYGLSDLHRKSWNYQSSFQ